MMPLLTWTVSLLVYLVVGLQPGCSNPSPARSLPLPSHPPGSDALYLWKGNHSLSANSPPHHERGLEELRDHFSLQSNLMDSGSSSRFLLIFASPNSCPLCSKLPDFRLQLHTQKQQPYRICFTNSHNCTVYYTCFLVVLIFRLNSDWCLA